MQHNPATKPRIAYFSMEVGLSAAIPTYSGGLGVLAGDTLRAAADMGLPIVGVTMLYHRGYFLQSIDPGGVQSEADVEWTPSEHLQRVALERPVTVHVEGREVALQVWRYTIRGVDGHEVPVLFLDADVEGNDERDRRLTNHLYGGDDRYRLAQEIVLGVGGRRTLAALGVEPRVFHMNEGHSSLLALDLLATRVDDGESVADAVAAVRARCVFTTHTPVPAGHDRFSRELSERVLGARGVGLLDQLPGAESGGELNMSHLGLALSGFVNGVARRHGEVSRGMFPGHTIHAITNGVHAATWTSAPFRALFDRHIPQWRRQVYALRLAERIPLDEIVAAHAEAKRGLFAALLERCGATLDPDLFTIGYARRSTAYKRPTLLFRDVRRLLDIAGRHGPLQIVYAGKAHPRDDEGKRLIAELHRLRGQLEPHVRLTFVPGYNMTLGGLLTSGVDLWLNTPRAPLEASGTSGMKASHNGVPNLSTRDGWWVEGCLVGHTGWAIEPSQRHGDDADADEARQLLDRLEHDILPLYGRGDPWAEVMRGSIAHAASYFNAQRMLDEYRTRAYGPALADA